MSENKVVVVSISNNEAHYYVAKSTMSIDEFWNYCIDAFSNDLSSFEWFSHSRELRQAHKIRKEL